MKIIKLENPEALSEHSARHVIELVRGKPSAVLGLATGETPIGTYEALIKDHYTHGTSYAKVKALNLDEYIGLSKSHPQSYHFFMKEHLFRHLDLVPSQTYLPDGQSPDWEQSCLDYDQLIARYPIDLQLLGIGANGHIGFNEPGTSFHSETHIVQLSDSTRKANARFFERPDEVPTHAITMGIRSILRSKKIVLLAKGTRKSGAIKRLIEGPVSEAFPASILRQHPQVTILADQDALSQVEMYEEERIL